MAQLPARKPSEVKNEVKPEVAQVAPPVTQSAPLLGALSDAADLINAIAPENPETPVASVVPPSIPPIPTAPPIPTVTFHVPLSRHAMLVRGHCLPLVPPVATPNGISLRWNPRPAREGHNADVNEVKIRTDSTPRRLYVGYGLTIPEGYQGQITSPGAMGETVPVLVLHAGKHDYDICIPVAYRGDSQHGIQLSAHCEIGLLTLHKVGEVGLVVEKG
jgi:hypothetical protein